MERLTMRQEIPHADGTNHIETYCHGHRYGPAAFPEKYGSSDREEYKRYCEMVDVLAAYEDTGLTPEEIKTVQAELAEYRKKEREGRLVEMLTVDEAGYDFQFEHYICPSCKTIIEQRVKGSTIPLHAPKYCDECGQKFNWSTAEAALKAQEGAEG